MKRSAPDHPKTRALAHALNRPRYAVVGILELLWHFAARFAPQGDVGRFPNTALAEALDYDGDAAVLITALVATGWLDACPTHRLLVHGWEEHADQGVKNTLRSRNLVFLSPTRRPKRSDPRVQPQTPNVRPVDPTGRQGTGTGTGTGSEGKRKEREKGEGEFAAFWCAYPRKVGKVDAQQAWQQTANDRPTLETTLGALAIQARSAQWQESPRYIPHPATWLRRHGWEDETDEQQARAAGDARAARIQAMKDAWFADHPEARRLEETP